MKKVIISLGTNLNNRLDNLKAAIKFLENVPDTKILQVSKIYESEPFEVPSKQDNYYNCCILLETELSPHILLGVCLGVEAAMGRKRTYKNAPRIIDIDLIYYEGETFNDRNLILPHPRAKDRVFILVPILDILNPEDKLREKVEFFLKKLDTTEIKEIGTIR